MWAKVCDRNMALVLKRQEGYDSMNLKKVVKEQVENFKTAEEKHQEDLERLREFRTIDDEFMRCFLKTIFHWQSWYCVL